MNEINLKILLVGDPNVGKTSLFLRYVDNNFPDKYLSTMGVEYRIKIYEYRGFRIKLQLWDTAGQERFHSITNNYFHNADGILFVYDITENKTFEGVKKWINESEESSNTFKKLLLGNKCDLKHKIDVTEEEVNEFCEEKNLEWFETSAKENINLEESFHKIVELILEGKTDDEIRDLFGVKANISFSSNEKEKKKKKKKEVICC